MQKKRDFMETNSVNSDLESTIKANSRLFSGLHTSRLFEIVEKNNVLWRREVFGHFCDVSSSDTVRT